MPLDEFTRARLALCALISAVALLAAFAELTQFPKSISLPHKSPGPEHALELSSQRSGRRQASAREAERQARAAELDSDRADALRTIRELCDPSQARAPSRRLMEFLVHPDWSVVEPAYRAVLRWCPEHVAQANTRLLARAMDEYRGSPARASAAARQPRRELLVRTILESIDRDTARSHRATLIELLAVAPDSGVCAAALRVAALAPPPLADWQQVLFRALQDPAESVRMAAAEAAAMQRWPDAIECIRTMASSPRPALRSRAGELLEQLGMRAEPVEYSEAVLRAARPLAERLCAAGLQAADVVTSPASGAESDRSQANDPSAAEAADDRAGEPGREQFRRQAEDFLDRAASGAKDSLDGTGVLWLALASRAGEPKLTIRLWEHEIARFDSDGEIEQAGLAALARLRLLRALDDYRHGDRTSALERLAAVSRIATQGAATDALRVYLEHAAELSVSIWQQAAAGEFEPTATPARLPPDATAQIAARILSQLDLESPADRAEAQRRLDAWCGLRHDDAAQPSRPLAN